MKIAEAMIEKDPFLSEYNSYLFLIIHVQDCAPAELRYGGQL